MTEGIVTIKAGREKSINRQHPWIFSGAIENNKHTTPGELVTVVDHKGRFLARGYWNPRSQIQVRIMTWQDEPIDEAWWRRMLGRAIKGRIVNLHINHPWEWMRKACRVVNAENDFIPGLIVDRYDDFLVLQALTLFIDRQKKLITSILVDLLKEWKITIKGVYERSDVDVRGKEGLKAETGVLWGEEPPELIEYQDSEYYFVDVRNGHKTGTYLDQYENREILFLDIVSEYYRGIYDADHQPEVKMLNLFSYTGAFGLRANVEMQMKVVNVDSSADALQLAKMMVDYNYQNNDDTDNSSLNNAFELIEADCFDYLHEAVKRGEQFDIIICDPPKFAHNAQQVDKAARGYKDLNLNAFKIIKSGGYLMTFSCSGAISPDLFQKIVFGALEDSGRQAQIIKHLGASADHPIALSFPEGEYLKGLLLRVY